MDSQHKAEIEPVSAVIRVWADESAQYGEPYEWVATVRWINRTDVEILGYTKPVTKSIYRAIVRECQRHGIRRVLSVTYPGGERREKWISIPTQAQQLYR